MPQYSCEECNFFTKLKGDYNRHLLTKKHINVTQKTPKNTINVTQKTPLFSEKNIAGYKCQYCDKVYKFRQGLNRHIKYTCTKNKDEDLKELARLLNEKDKQLKERDNLINELIELQNSQYSKLTKQIGKLTNKLQIKNIVNGNITNYNIQLLNYNQTDYSHLTDTDYVKCIKDCNSCVKSLIEKVHFNEQKPENKNIYISNIKGDYAMIYKSDKWQIVNKQTQIDDLYNYNEVILENWYEEYKDKYPKIIESFKKYLKNKDENVVINKVKDEILVLLYNNRT